MKIRCWGARGSIPVSGPEYERYGGDTTCLELRPAEGDDLLVVDAGSGVRRLSNHLLAEGRREFHFLFTHMHWDHILGFPFFKPLYLEDARLNIHSCPGMQGNMETLLSRTMDAPYFPVPYEVVRARIEYSASCPEVFSFGSMEVRHIPLSHPNQGRGFRFTENGRSFVFLTDNELDHVHRGGRSFEEYVEFCRGADVLFHDAEYADDEYARRATWGHSTASRALELAMAAGVARFGLFHHNQDRSDEEVDAMVERCRSVARERGGPECFGVTQETEIEL